MTEEPQTPNNNVSTRNSCDQIQDLFSQVLILQKDMTSMKETVRSQQEELLTLKYTNSGLCHENSNLRTELNSLRESHVACKAEIKTCRQDFAELQLYLTEFHEEHESLFTDQERQRIIAESLRTDVNNVKTACESQELEGRNVRTRLGETIQEMESLKEELMVALRTEMTSVREEMATLRAEMTSVREEAASRGRELELIVGDAVEQIQSLRVKVEKLESDQIGSVLTQQERLLQSQDNLVFDVGALRTQVKRFKTSMESSLEKTASSISELEVRVGKARRLFFATGLNADKTRQGQAMVFQTTWISLRLYNDSTGVFTAPHPGLYFFTATLRSLSPEDTVYAHIVVGESTLHAVIRGGSLGGSGCVLVPLSARQKVWLKAFSPVDHYRGADVNFSGTLVLSST